MRAGAAPRRIALSALLAALLAPFLGVAGLAAGASAAAPALRLDVPRNDGWVTDLAGLLSADEESALEASMESYKQGSGNDIALLTVADLDGEPIEDFALRVAREWKLGSVETNNGALLVVSKGDRALRIEVGRGLEGTLTDAIGGRIIHDAITPQFQAGNFADGLRLGIEAMQKAAGGDYAVLPEPQPRHSGGAPFIPLFIFVLIMIIVSRRRRRGGPGGRSRGSIWPWLVLANSMGRGSGGGSSGGGSGGGGFGGFGGFGGGGGGGFGGFGGGGGFSGGGASGKW